MRFNIYFLLIFLTNFSFSLDHPLATIKKPIKTDFATYYPFSTSVVPSVPPYQINPDLSNVENISFFNLTPEQKDLLSQNGFFITSKSTYSVGTGYNEMYDIYLEAAEKGLPIFVTSDTMLHIYHRFFDGILQKIEEEKFYPKLKELDLLLFQDAYNLDEKIDKESSFILASYFALSCKLLDPSFDVPSKYFDVVEAEINLIEEHSKVNFSPIFKVYELNYTSFKPRGHYTKSEKLKRYFKAMMWHGKAGFPLKDFYGNPSIDITASALFLTQFMQNEKEKLWYDIYRPTIFFVGSADDLLYKDYLNIAKETYGENFYNLKPEEILKLEKLNEFIEKAETELPDPLIRDFVGKGLRFMGQRFIPDSFIFTKLTDPEVKGRFLPTALDVMAILGSDFAFEILNYKGETNYNNYIEKFEFLKNLFEKYPEEKWVENLYYNWLYSLMPLLYPKGEGYPNFMQNNAWVKKELNSALGSWTELRHDTILYTKESLGGGGPIENYYSLLSYVEPNPELYGRLASLSFYTLNGLEYLNLLSKSYKIKLNFFIDLLIKIKSISEKELKNQIIDSSEVNLLANFGKIIYDLVSDPNSEKNSTYLEDDPMPIVADVHTDLNSNVCLEEGVGFPMRILVVVPHRGKLYLTVGAVFSYYEFTQPISERLSDEEWREMLKGENAPALPFWIEDIKDSEESINSNPLFVSLTKLYNDIEISYEIEGNNLILWVEIPLESLNIESYLNDEKLNLIDLYSANKGTKAIFEIPEIENGEIVIWIKGYDGFYERILSIEIGDKNHKRPF